LTTQRRRGPDQAQHRRDAGHYTESNLVSDHQYPVDAGNSGGGLTPQTGKIVLGERA
jgi:hypothetical protein